VIDPGTRRIAAIPIPEAIRRQIEAAPPGYLLASSPDGEQAASAG
jgi:hypothetical protein